MEKVTTEQNNNEKKKRNEHTHTYNANNSQTKKQQIVEQNKTRYASNNEKPIECIYKNSCSPMLPELIS